MESLKFETSSAYVTVADKKIFKINHYNEHLIEFKDIQELFDLYKDLRNQDIVNKILIIGGGRTSITTDARELAETLVHDVLGEGIVVKSLTERIFANFYFLIKKKAYPIKIFSTESQAITWLNTL